MQESFMSKPMIGVTTKRGDPEWVAEHTQPYLDVLARFGASTVVLSPNQPVLFPNGESFDPDEQGRLPRAVLDQLDGLLLTGGGDVEPSYFGAELDGANPDAIDIPRDELELALSKDALAIDMPIFGICRGCQVLNVAAGGGMVQHFEGHSSTRANPNYHDILVTPETKLHKIVKTERLPSNTYHHQGLDHETLAPDFVATGIADPDRWLVEAFESKKHAWVVAVQWHPERLDELDDTHEQFWSAFVQACKDDKMKKADKVTR